MKWILKFSAFKFFFAVAVFTSCKKIDPISLPPAQSSTNPIKAVAGIDQTITLPTDSVTLNGSASTGAINIYQWTKISGPTSLLIGNASAVKTVVKKLVPGTYLFEL